MHLMAESTLDAMKARTETVRQISDIQYSAGRRPHAWYDGEWSGPELTREQIAECHRIIRDTCAAFGVTPHEAGYEPELCTNGCCVKEAA
jgi:hypothetical protein